MTNKTDAAFERYCADPIVQEALEMDKARGQTLTTAILRDCFMAGAKYAIARCEAEHHVSRKLGD